MAVGKYVLSALPWIDGHSASRMDCWSGVAIHGTTTQLYAPSNKKYFTAILISISFMGSVNGQVNGLPPLDGGESGGMVRIQGIAMTHAEGLPFSLTWFFPKAWNPIDTLRGGQPIAISLMKTKTEYEKVCARGITLQNFTCFWECQLVLSKDDIACLSNTKGWLVSTTSLPFTESESYQAYARKVRSAVCLKTPYISFTLEPLSEGSDRRRNHRLRRQLR